MSEISLFDCFDAFETSALVMKLIRNTVLAVPLCASCMGSYIYQCFDSDYFLSVADLLSNAAHLVDKLLDYSNELLEACADETLVGAVSEALKQMR